MNWELPPLSEDWLRKNVWPRFSRVMKRKEIYLANHSLGRPLDQMADDVAAAVDHWYSDMDDAWGPWMAETQAWRAKIAQLIGASAEAIVPKTSAGQGLRAVLNAFPQDRPVRVVTTRGEFDSIDFILKTYAYRGRADVTWVEAASSDRAVPLYTAESIADAIPKGGPPGLVVASLVFFGTGQILRNAAALVRAAHEKGWLVLLDIYHAAGVIPVDMKALGADFAIGGSYKYLRGGPGACYLALGSSGFGELRSLDTGWFAKRNTFGYERSDTPEFADRGDGWLESTPPVLMPFQARSGLDLVLELGVEQLRAYSLEQQALLRHAFARWGIDAFDPGDPTEFGAFCLLQHPRAAEFCADLKGKGINVDSRGEFVRFGPDILNSEDELFRAAEIAGQ